MKITKDHPLSSDEILMRSRVMRSWTMIVLLIPVWWLSGLNLFIYHITGALFLLSLFHSAHRSGKAIYIPVSVLPLCLIAIVSLASIIMHMGVSTPQRVVAALYNFSFWIMGIMWIVVLSNHFYLIDIRRILNSFRPLGWVIGIMSLLVMGLWFSGVEEWTFKTPLAFLVPVLGDTYLIRNNLMPIILSRDIIFSGYTPRLAVFTAYSNEASGAIMMIGLMIYMWADFHKKFKNIIWIILFLLVFGGLCLTSSRTATLAYFFSFAFMVLAGRRDTLPWILLGLMIFLLAVPWTVEFVNWFIGLKKWSAAARLDLYRYTFDQIRGMEAVIGHGMRPRITSVSVMSLGSHSTFLSILFRSGVVGLAALVFFQLSMFWRWYHMKALVLGRRRYYAVWKGIGGILVGMCLWMTSYDLDAPPVVAFLYFSILGIFEGYRHRILHISRQIHSGRLGGA